MRTWLATNKEVAEFWAGRTQPSGKTKNFFFEEDKLFSWGHHFCVARHIDDATTIVTTHRDRSVSTREHRQYALNYLCDKKVVYALDPSGAAWKNRNAALVEIKEALDDADLPRIRQPRRDRGNATAEYLAKQFNEYLAALPEAERGATEPLPENAAKLREYFIVQHVITQLER